MFEASARNLRTVERFLLVPPLSADFGSALVSISDISAQGARFRHEGRLETGKKGLLKFPAEGRSKPVAVEAVVVWSEPDALAPGRFVSGVRTYGAAGVITSLIAQLQTSHRSNRIEELRGTDRFLLSPPLTGDFAGHAVRISNLSARGGGIDTTTELRVGQSGVFAFRVPDSTVDVSVDGVVGWAGVKAITGSAGRTWRGGLSITNKPERMRLAIGQLAEQNRAALDTHSLGLKLKIMRARARQFASSYKSVEDSGVPAEQYLLVLGVREELRLNADEAMHWYRRARLVINDPQTRVLAPMIADYPDALAVWEYLDRSVDPSIVGRALSLPSA